MRQWQPIQTEDLETYRETSSRVVGLITFCTILLGVIDDAIGS
jgi:hypothetical protein